MTAIIEAGKVPKIMEPNSNAQNISGQNKQIWTNIVFGSVFALLKF